MAQQQSGWLQVWLQRRRRDRVRVYVNDFSLGRACLGAECLRSTCHIARHGLAKRVTSAGAACSREEHEETAVLAFLRTRAARDLAAQVATASRLPERRTRAQTNSRFDGRRLMTTLGIGADVGALSA